MAKRREPLPKVTTPKELAPENTVPPSLEHIRIESLRVRVETARMISDLEEWRDEIDATIAFLKAQRK